MQADAFLFELLVQAGRRGDRRVADVRPHAAEPAQPRRGRAHGRPRDRRHQHRRAGDGARHGGAPEARAHHPELPEPGRLHALRGQAHAAAGAGRRARLHDLRGRPVRRDPLRGRDDPTRCSRQDDAGRVVYASLVLQDRLPGHPRRLPGRPAGGHQADPDDRDQHVHLAEHGRPVDRQPVRPLRAHGRRDRRRSRPRCRPAATRSSPRSSASSPRRSSPRPSGGYFMWVELPEGSTWPSSRRPRPSATCCSSRAPTSCSRAARTRCASRTRA